MIHRLQADRTCHKLKREHVQCRMFSWAATGIITLDDLLQYLHAIVQAMARYSNGKP